MLVSIGATCTYRDLYPNALGYSQDLDQVIEIQRLSEVWTEGDPASHDSMHKYPVTAVPVVDCATETIDLTKVIIKQLIFKHLFCCV